MDNSEAFAIIRRYPGRAEAEPVDPSDGRYRPFAAPPREFDWSDHVSLPDADLQQGQSCFAHASASVTMTALRRMGTNTLLDQSHCHVCIFGYPIIHPIFSEAGALGRLSEQGFSPSFNPPFFPGNEDLPADDCPQVGVHYPIASFQRLYSDFEAMAWIATKGPIIAIMELQDSFMEAYAGRYSVYRDDGSTERGKHAVMLYGYDNSDSTNAHWIGQNSFGGDWGKNGRFRIGFGERSLFSSNSHLGFGLIVSN